MLKVCRRCKQEKPVSDYWKIWTGSKKDKPPSETTTLLINQIGNYQQYCKECSLAWQQGNRDKYILYQQRYRDKKKDNEGHERGA